MGHTPGQNKWPLHRGGRCREVTLSEVRLHYNHFEVTSECYHMLTLETQTLTLEKSYINYYYIIIAKGNIKGKDFVS